MSTKTKISFIIIALLAFCACEKDRPVKFDLEYSTFTDNRDGYEYKTVTIDGTTWLAENFRYLPVVDGNDVDSVSFDGPRYYVYNYNGTDVNEAKATDEYKKYGVLYNYEAAEKSCPEGWHLPTKDDFAKLIKSINNDKADKYGNYEFYTTVMLCGDRELWGLSDSTHILLNVSGLGFVPGGIMQPDYFYEETPQGYEQRDSVKFKDLGIYCFVWEKKRGREKDYLSGWTIRHDTTPMTQIDFRMEEYVSNISKNCGLAVRYVKD